MTTRHSAVETALGALTLVADGDDLIGLYFPHHWYLPRPDSIGDPVDWRSDALLAEVARQLDDYLAGRRRSFDLPTRTSGDAFSEQVWTMLREVPYGATTTYGELAHRLGDRSQAQAVGQAVGHNPISIVIPCHRVVGTDGRLTGYAGGLPRKRFLLELEEPALVKAGRLF